MTASPSVTKPRFDGSRHPAAFRVGVLLLIVITIYLYVPINRGVSGGITPMTSLDEVIQLHPAWAVPYLLSIIWWFSAFLWATLKMDLPRLKTFTVAFLVMTLSSYVVYLLYPTYVNRPELVGEGWTVDLIRFIYGNDQPYNALPSGHTYNTTLIAIFWWYWKPRWRWLWVATVPVVILSTLFTKQHYLLDPVFGMIWAFGATFLAKKIAGWTPAEKDQ